MIKVHCGHRPLAEDVPSLFVESKPAGLIEESDGLMVRRGAGHLRRLELRLRTSVMMPELFRAVSETTSSRRRDRSESNL
jgi:hypothetical protein